jgi:hypothetical protein
MKLNANNWTRLYRLSAKPNERGRYTLEPFPDDNAAFNQDIEEDSLDESLTELAADGSWHEIKDDNYGNDGKIHINFDGEDRLEIRNFTDLIDHEPEKCRLFVLVDAERSEYEIVVAVHSGTVYSG